MSENIGLKLYETRTLSDKQGLGGSDVVPFYVISGSRLLLSFQVESLDLGASVTFAIDNSFNELGPWDNLGSVSAVAPGLTKRVFSDFHSGFRIRVTVTGGTATYRIGATIYDNAIATKIENATIDVNLNDAPDAEGRYDIVRIGDGIDQLGINADGSINVALVEAADEHSVIKFNDVAAISASTPTTLLSYTVPVSKVAFLNRISVSGENIAAYDVKINGDLVGRKRTYFGGNLNEVFEFWTSVKRGHRLEAGDIVEVIVSHERPWDADFEATLQVLEKG